MKNFLKEISSKMLLIDLRNVTIEFWNMVLVGLRWWWCRRRCRWETAASHGERSERILQNQNRCLCTCCNKSARFTFNFWNWYLECTFFLLPFFLSIFKISLSVDEPTIIFKHKTTFVISYICGSIYSSVFTFVVFHVPQYLTINEHHLVCVHSIER